MYDHFTVINSSSSIFLYKDLEPEDRFKQLWTLSSSYFFLNNHLTFLREGVFIIPVVYSSVEH